jgi:hypothetical protein
MVGEDEVAAGLVTLKPLRDQREQARVAPADLPSLIGNARD